MDLITILVSVLRAGLPLPDFNNEAAVKTWLDGLTPSLAAIIVRLVPDSAGLCEAPDPAAVVQAVQIEVPEANGEIIRRLMDLILMLAPYLLPLLLKTTPAPTPAPGPVA